MAKATQSDFFESLDDQPEGFRYIENVVSADEERELIDRFASLPFKEFEFQGFLGRRRAISFGWRYDCNRGG